MEDWDRPTGSASDADADSKDGGAGSGRGGNAGMCPTSQVRCSLRLCFVMESRGSHQRNGSHREMERTCAIVVVPNHQGWDEGEGVGVLSRLRTREVT